MQSRKPAVALSRSRALDATRRKAGRLNRELLESDVAIFSQREVSGSQTRASEHTWFLASGMYYGSDEILHVPHRSCKLQCDAHAQLWGNM
eukprot:6207554-Pleurochrysis_carterae.AAC.1